ncbi:MAG TPA: tripartite tricarboxylate transporter permease [Pseudonocardia sp.]|mgnify:CR=1 FL=1|jgi:TctA family transporter|uniref:tripartite tricarboxylate transporter permease n=1 Tax=Pseudonocardia sp. TaxID=60912 RepID=UPI002B4B7C90|nr:tripartite tricarboxylate transporter permease [Pseudonocardia sp.]HLU59709.1 tripartite tricarboxylate transporter permease [Pseudonocardia sp.]
MLTDALNGLTQVFQPVPLALMLLGVAIGFAVGILPGLGGAVTLALMLPFTFDMQPVEAFAFLLGMWVVTSTAGDITSVLFGVPGEATSAATVLDGHPMTKRGEGARALGAVLLSSALGAVFGAFVLALSIPVLRPVVLAFGPPEFFALTVLGLTFVVALSGKRLLKGFAMAGLGLFVALVGLDPQEGVQRYTFDLLYLWDGIGIVPLVVGLFGGAEVLQIMLSKRSIARADTAGTSLAGVGQGIRDVVRHWALVIRSSAIGTGIGIVPGLGGTVAQFLAYGAAQQSSKTPEMFGKGSVEGVIAAGAVNNAKDSGSLIPTIGFGIPGGAGSAVLLSAFLIVGLNPGQEMLTTQLDVTFSMIWITVLANAIAVAAAFVFLKPLTRLTFVSGPLLVPFLLLLLTLGAYTSSNSAGDIVVMLGAAALGVACIRYDWPRVPFLLAVVLGSLAERYLFLSHSLYGWSWLSRPIVVVIGLAMATTILVPAIRRRRARRAARATTGEAV